MRMPSDPGECRKHAAYCTQLALEANTERLKAHFIDLSKNWEDLAKELQRRTRFPDRRTKQKLIERYRIRDSWRP